MIREDDGTAQNMINAVPKLPNANQRKFKETRCGDYKESMQYAMAANSKKESNVHRMGSR